MTGYCNRVQRGGFLAGGAQSPGGMASPLRSGVPSVGERAEADRTAADSVPPVGGSRRGFTMIELMAAMAILLMITLFVGRIFSDSTKMWKLGTRRVTNAMDGRAVVDFIVREMSSAIADDVLVFAHKFNADSDVLGMDSDRIYFTTTDQRAELDSQTYLRRQVRQVSYLVSNMLDVNNDPIVGRYRIVRNMRNNSIGAANDFTCYTTPNWWTSTAMNYEGGEGSGSGSDTLAENVRTLEFWVYDRAGNLRAGTDYNSKDHGPPGWIEIYVELLGEDDAIKASQLSGAAASDFADRSSRRYVGRVYLNNGRGYAPDL